MSNEHSQNDSGESETPAVESNPNSGESEISAWSAIQIAAKVKYWHGEQSRADK
ncbi:hypothetical protein LQZ18_09085 [Lachnospiraceae bacterium ZAX-1]